MAKIKYSIEMLKANQELKYAQLSKFKDQIKTMKDRQANLCDNASAVKIAAES